MELGITSPLTQTGACKFAKSWLVDTATIYRIGITRTGTVVLALALGNVALGATMMALNKNDPWAGLGLWTGLTMIISGLVCLLMRQKRPVNIVSILSCVCMIGFMTALVSMATSSFNIWALYDDPAKRYPRYVQKLPDYTSLYIMNGLLLFMSLFQVCFTFWALCLSVGYIWPCLRISGSSIFTIMVEDDPVDRTLGSDQDTEMSAFTVHNNHQVQSTDTQGTLQIQTEWLQQMSNGTEITR